MCMCPSPALQRQGLAVQDGAGVQSCGLTARPPHARAVGPPGVWPLEKAHRLRPPAHDDHRQRPHRRQRFRLSAGCVWCPRARRWAHVSIFLSLCPSVRTHVSVCVSVFARCPLMNCCGLNAWLFRVRPNRVVDSPHFHRCVGFDHRPRRPARLCLRNDAVRRARNGVSARPGSSLLIGG